MNDGPIVGMRQWMKRVDSTLRDYRSHRHPALSARIDNLAAVISSLGGEVGTVEGSIGDLETRVSNLEDAVGALPVVWGGVAPANSGSDGTLDFPGGLFTATPVVTATVLAGSTSSGYNVHITSASASSVTFRAFRLDGGSFIGASVYVVAVQV